MAAPPLTLTLGPEERGEGEGRYAAFWPLPAPSPA